jgi:hypothetical protein
MAAEVVLVSVVVGMLMFKFSFEFQSLVAQHGRFHRRGHVG